MLTSCGWTDRVRSICQDEQANRSVENITPEELSWIFCKKATQSIPDSVNTEILKDVHNFVGKYC